MGHAVLSDTSKKRVSVGGVRLVFAYRSVDLDRLDLAQV